MTFMDVLISPAACSSQVAKIGVACVRVFQLPLGECCFNLVGSVKAMLLLIDCKEHIQMAGSHALLNHTEKSASGVRVGSQTKWVGPSNGAKHFTESTGVTL